MTRRASGTKRPTRNAGRLAGSKGHPHRTTLLSLVVKVGRHVRTDREVVALVRRLVNSGRVELVGSFKGQRFE